MTSFITSSETSVIWVCIDINVSSHIQQRQNSCFPYKKIPRKCGRENCEIGRSSPGSNIFTSAFIVYSSLAHVLFILPGWVAQSSPSHSTRAWACLLPAGSNRLQMQVVMTILFLHFTWARNRQNSQKYIKWKGQEKWRKTTEKQLSNKNL